MAAVKTFLTAGAVRVIDGFIDNPDLSGPGFKTEADDTGRPAYHPSKTSQVTTSAN